MERAGIPFVTKGLNLGVETPKPQIGDISPFLRQCRAAKVSRVLVIGFGEKHAFKGFCARFTDAGLSVEPSFARPRETWPQLIFWADDFLTVGGLLGLMERGVSIPRDVFAVTVANKGFVPVYPRSLARFEFDPAATGRAAAAQIIGRLAGSPATPICEVVRYVPGESLPARLGN